MLRYLPLLLTITSAAHAVELDAVTSAIEAGDYKQVTSVVVARRGKPIYERYFDKEGADNLRNTRSVTKTIAEVGAASVKDMGKVMAVLKERYAGQMDFSKASAATKDALSGK